MPVKAKRRNYIYRTKGGRKARSRKFASAVKRVILRTAETKYYDQTMNAQAVLAAWYSQGFPSMSGGTASTQRLGDEIYIQGFSWVFNIVPSTVASSEIIQGTIMIVTNKKFNDLDIVPNDMAATPWYGPPDFDSVQVIKRKYFTFSVNNPGNMGPISVKFKGRKKFKRALKLRYDPDVSTTIPANRYFWIFIRTTSINGVYVSGYVRTYFKDP